MVTSIGESLSDGALGFGSGVEQAVSAPLKLFLAPLHQMSLWLLHVLQVGFFFKLVFFLLGAGPHSMSFFSAIMAYSLRGLLGLAVVNFCFLLINLLRVEHLWISIRIGSSYSLIG